jgi:hypothetical protein
MAVEIGLVVGRRIRSCCMMDEIQERGRQEEEEDVVDRGETRSRAKYDECQSVRDLFPPKSHFFDNCPIPRTPSACIPFIMSPSDHTSTDSESRMPKVRVVPSTPDPAHLPLAASMLRPRVRLSRLYRIHLV